jgi:hypothetical protein
VIGAIVANPTTWADGYDPALVAQSWKSLLGGRGRPADERLLQRVIWRAVFEDYLAEVNGASPALRTATVQQIGQLPNPMTRGRRYVARGLRKLARIIEVCVATYPTATIR